MQGDSADETLAQFNTVEPGSSGPVVGDVVAEHIPVRGGPVRVLPDHEAELGGQGEEKAFASVGWDVRIGSGALWTAELFGRCPVHSGWRWLNLHSSGRKKMGLALVVYMPLT